MYALGAGWPGLRPSSVRVMRVLHWNRWSALSPCASPSRIACSTPADAICDWAIISACERSSNCPARARPAEKTSKASVSTTASSTKATTTSISVKPRCLFIDRHPPREPVDVHEVLALAGLHGDASSGGAAVRIEADRAAVLAHHLGLGRVELEVDVLRQLVRVLLAGRDVLARLHVDREERVATRGERRALRGAQARRHGSRGGLQVRGRGLPERDRGEHRVERRAQREHDEDLDQRESGARAAHVSS